MPANNRGQTCHSHRQWDPVEQGRTAEVESHPGAGACWQVPGCSNNFLVISKLPKVEASLQTLYEQIKEVWLHREVFDGCSAPLFSTLILLLLHYSNLLSTFIGVR